MDRVIPACTLSCFRNEYERYYSREDEVELRQEPDYIPDKDEDGADLSQPILEVLQSSRPDAWLKFKLRKLHAPMLQQLICWQYHALPPDDEAYGEGDDDSEDEDGWEEDEDHDDDDEVRSGDDEENDEERKV
jgi:hypothetical protein